MIAELASKITNEHLLKIQDMVLDYSGILMDRLLLTQSSRKIATQMYQYSLLEPNEYISLLCHSGVYTFVMEDLISALTVNESYFFRNYEQFDYLYHKFFLNYFNDPTRNVRPMKIWSAGCSRGEEPYSVSIILNKFREQCPWVEFNIRGGDINTINLQVASRGEYTPRSVRGNFNGFGKAYEMVPGSYNDIGNFVVGKEYQERVSFEKLNLNLENDLKKLMWSDIILCRNVLIYFSDELRMRLLDTFFKYLNPGGLLLMGETETLVPDGLGFVCINHNKALIYEKPR